MVNSAKRMGNSASDEMTTFKNASTMIDTQCAQTNDLAKQLAKEFSERSKVT